MNIPNSSDASCQTVVRAANGQLFPVSASAVDTAEMDFSDNGVMSAIVFTMRSEPGRITC